MIMAPEMDVTGSGRYEPHAGRELCANEGKDIS